MLHKLQSFFSKNKEESSIKHPKVDMTDASKCPYLKSKENQKQHENKHDGQTQSDSEEDQPQGGCPFMATSNHKKNPSLALHIEGYDELFPSKYKYFLSDKKIDFDFSLNKNGMTKSRVWWDSLPIYLKHTLFYQGEDFKKVRTLQCCTRFMAYEQMRQRGNKYYGKQKYYKALQYYQKAMSIYRWLQVEQNNQLQNPKQLSQSIKSQISNSDLQSQCSKIKLNLNNSITQINHADFNQLRNKYKQFFVVFNDDNVNYFNGQQFTDTADIDMRKSLLMQIYLNMAAVYINLHYYTLAKQIINDSLVLASSSQSLLRLAQAYILNKRCTAQEAHRASQLMERAIELRKTEKIFASTNPNILKMLNIHDSEQVYQSTLMEARKKALSLQERVRENSNLLSERMEEIKQIEKRILSQGKQPSQSWGQCIYSTIEYGILLKMRQKYLHVMEFYYQAKNIKQVKAAKNELQEVLRVLAEIDFIQQTKVDLKEQDERNKLAKRLTAVKRELCEDLYNKGRFNLHMLEWVIKDVVKEQTQLRKKQEQQQNPSQLNENHSQLDSKGGIKKFIPFFLLLPIIIILLTILL